MKNIHWLRRLFILQASSSYYNRIFKYIFSINLYKSVYHYRASSCPCSCGEGLVWGCFGEWNGICKEKTKRERERVSCISNGYGHMSNSKPVGRIRCAALFYTFPQKLAKRKYTESRTQHFHTRRVISRNHQQPPEFHTCHCNMYEGKYHISKYRNAGKVEHLFAAFDPCLEMIQKHVSGYSVTPNPEMYSITQC